MQSEEKKHGGTLGFLTVLGGQWLTPVRLSLLPATLPAMVRN